jgi:membrane-bound lytic murein transglycosylase B
MMHRRTLLASIPAFAAPALIESPAAAAATGSFVPTAEDQASFVRYIEGVKQEARQMGISPSVIDAAFAHVRLNGRVIYLDRNQPEVQFTWQRYRSSIVSDNRVAGGRAQYGKHAALLRRVEDAYGVPGPVIVGLWGLESDYGRDVGTFNVVECVATLAWEGRRRAYFHSELIDCLRILQAGDIQPQQMLGSWAGAMGQTQFMPDCFVKYAVDFDRRGKRDLWNDFACVFASTANNIQAEGWRRGMPWGVAVTLPAAFDPTLIGRSIRHSLEEWTSYGIRRQDGTALPRGNTAASLVQPGAPDDSDTYLVYASQFAALRAYNPSDKYAICIGLLADRIGGQGV